MVATSVTHLVLHSGYKYDTPGYGGYKCDTWSFMVATSVTFMEATCVTHLVLHGGYKCDTPGPSWWVQV